MKHITKFRVIGVSLIILGILCALPSIFLWAQQRQALADTPKVSIPAVQEVTSTMVVGHPSRLVIPSLGIDIPVLNGEYNAKNGSWTLTEKNAHFALPSILPNNESGNTLIYGHYNKYVFSKLHTIAPGAEVMVHTTEGNVFVYKFESTEALSQTDVNVLLYEGPSRLTLQTCSGTFMQNRQMFYFSFVRYE